MLHPLIIPGIFVAVKLSVTFAAVVVERAGPGTAISRSWNLTRDNWWRAFGVVLVVFLIVAVISFAFTTVFLGAVLTDVSEVTFATLSTIMSIVINAITYPLWAAVITVLYYDLRVRNEGFDLQLLAAGVGADASRFESAPERPMAPEAPGSTAPPSSPGGFTPPEGPTTSP